MAVNITETGRNSATVAYGGISTGADIWDTFRAVDKWIRNDNLSGTVTAATTTVTGTNTVFLKQLVSGDQIMIGSQVRTVATIPNDTTFTVTSAFNPAITLPSTAHYIRGSLTGTSAVSTIRGTTNGTVATTAGSSIVTGTNTWFMSCATNSVVPILLSGTVAVSSSTDIPANTITGTGTSFVTGDHTSSTRLQPGDSITVLSNGRSFYFEVNQVNSDTSVTVVSGPTTAIAAGAQIYKATNGAIGRTISINGQIRQIAALTSNTSLTVNAPFDFTDSGLRMKTYPRGTVANAVAGTRIQSTGCSSSGTTLTVAATLTGLVAVGSALQITAGTGALATGVATTILNQITGSGTSVTSASCSGSSGTNTVILSATNSLVRVGQLLSGVGAPIGGIDPDTYVTTISGTTVTLSKNLSGNLSGTTVQFYNPGGLGTYTLSATPTTSLSAATVTFSTIQGTNTNFAWDLADGDQVWIGDELRTFKFSTSGTGITSTTTGGAVDIGYILDYTGYTGTTPIHTMRQLYQGVLLRPEESYINGTGTAFLTELRVGDELNIEGTDAIVSQILSNTRFRIATDFSHTLSTSSIIYKKLKIHGNVLEGNRDGGTTAGNKFSQATTILATVNSVFLAGTNQITIASATNFNQFNLIKIHGAGGKPVVLTGIINTVSASTTVTGTGTLFTTELFVGAEISIAGQYFVVASIASDTSMTVNSTMTVVGPTPIYRTIPHYSAIASASGSAAVTLAQPIQHTVYATAANPCIVYTPNTGADFIEYVYSSPNKSAEASTVLLNTSLDRKYFGFRFYPLMQNATTYSAGNIINGYTPTATTTISTALGGWNTPVYERWAAGYAGTGGVGINLADCSGGTVMIGSQPGTTTFTLSNLICGSVAVPATTTQYSPFAAGVADNVVTGITGGTVNAAGSTYSTTLSPTISGTSPVVIGGISTVFDTQIGSQTSGGLLYLFGNSRYFCLQGKTLANVPTNWIGCFEFERAQPEDLGTGTVGTTGITISSFNLAGGVAAGSTFLTEPAKSQGMGASAVLYASGATPYPCYGYINGQRMPVGASQYPSLPGPGNAPVHGNVISVPRLRSSPTDLVGVNAHTYSAFTITLGRWGHLYDLAATGAYISPGTIASNGLPVQTTTAPATATVDSIPQPHLGQIVPINTNLYGGRRFMFSPIVILGNAVDPDIRGRIYGLKVVSSNLGTLMDTVSINIDSNQFYDASGTTTDHWLLTAAVRTFRYTLRNRTDTTDPRQSYRSLEDTATQTANTIATAFANNFRVALAV